MQRKLGFLPLEEYIDRYPHIDPKIFGTGSGRIANHMFNRWSQLDGTGEQSVVFVKNIGSGWTAEDVQNVLGSRLGKMPRSVQV